MAPILRKSPYVQKARKRKKLVSYKHTNKARKRISSDRMKKRKKTNSGCIVLKDESSEVIVIDSDNEDQNDFTSFIEDRSCANDSFIVPKYHTVCGLSIPSKNETDSIEIIDQSMDSSIIFVSETLPDTMKQNVPRTNSQKRKRMIVVDGSNVALHHRNSKNFSVEGLKICIDYFENLGHEVKVVIPQFRLKLNKSSNQKLLEKLVKQGKVLLTPCKNLPGKLIAASYDDRFILQVASMNDAAIISNDNFNDLVQENSAWAEIITSRVVGFMWCNDQFFLPQDPYGRRGPKLDQILYSQK